MMYTCQLEGMGTKEKPWLIHNAEELEYFSQLVNEGRTFEDEYVLQTQDIDLSAIKNWRPIGEFGKNNYFKGVYNGNGYAIKNMTIHKKEENVGLFGFLEGTVMNVMLMNCDIVGSCVGGITSHGIHDTIINCYVNGVISGSIRAGGIADNAGAYIANCIADVKLSGDKIAGITSYHTNKIINSFSNYGDDIYIYDGQAILDVNSDAMNACIKKHKNESYYDLLNKWGIENNELVLIHKE